MKDIELAKLIKNIIKEQKSDFNYLYDINDIIEHKIDDICFKVYGVNEVIFNEKVQKQIKIIEKLGYSKLPICIAKTLLFLNDGSKNFKQIHIEDISVSVGDGFLVVKTGKIMTMPGLLEHPLAEQIRFTNDQIVGLI